MSTDFVASAYTLDVSTAVSRYCRDAVVIKNYEQAATPVSVVADDLVPVAALKKSNTPPEYLALTVNAVLEQFHTQVVQQRIPLISYNEELCLVTRDSFGTPLVQHLGDPKIFTAVMSSYYNLVFDFRITRNGAALWCTLEQLISMYSLHVAPKYDLVYHYLQYPQLPGTLYPSVTLPAESVDPSTPTLKEFMNNFFFLDDGSREIALSALLYSFSSLRIEHPMFVVRPMPGVSCATGKSTFFEMIGYLLGKTSTDPAEPLKDVKISFRCNAGDLIDQHTYISTFMEETRNSKIWIWDNIEGSAKSETLCSWLTLGAFPIVGKGNYARNMSKFYMDKLVVITSNNITLGKDELSRTFHITVAPFVEDPLFKVRMTEFIDKYRLQLQQEILYLLKKDPSYRTMPPTKDRCRFPDFVFNIVSKVMSQEKLGQYLTANGAIVNASSTEASQVLRWSDHIRQKLIDMGHMDMVEYPIFIPNRVLEELSKAFDNKANTVTAVRNITRDVVMSAGKGALKYTDELHGAVWTTFNGTRGLEYKAQKGLKYDSSGILDGYPSLNLGHCKMPFLSIKSGQSNVPIHTPKEIELKTYHGTTLEAWKEACGKLLCHELPQEGPAKES